MRGLTKVDLRASIINSVKVFTVLSVFFAAILFTPLARWFLPALPITMGQLEIVATGILLMTAATFLIELLNRSFTEG